MLVSYNWLQTYFKEPLPEPKKLADIITMGVFEIESLEEKAQADGSKDFVLDLKVLPDRASYCLSHRYVAQEIGALLGYDYVIPEIEEFEVGEAEYEFEASIEGVIDEDSASPESAGQLADRYVTRVIENVTVGPSPEWLKARLETLGQRSINALVDLTNYLMLETGQPLHVFDADKIKGNITIRRARAGEQVTTLDGKTVELDPSITVIADDEGPLDIAGIKGGKKAELTSDTTRVMTSAGCFNPTRVRRAVRKTGVRTDASKRFENSVTPERAGLAESMLASLVKKLMPDSVVGEVIDIYPNPEEPKTITVALRDIVDRLGVEVEASFVERALIRCGFVIDASDAGAGDAKFIVSIPPYRRDISITEDIVDEVGRIHGYGNIEGTAPKADAGQSVNKNFHYHNLIRRALADAGFSEALTYSLTDKGSMEVQNPLTSERSCMRDSISYMLSKKFLPNMKNADLIGVKEIRMFEMGKVFGKGYGAAGNSLTGDQFEKNSIAFGIARSKQPKGHDPKLELSAIAHYVVDKIGASSVPDMKFTELSGDAQTPCAGWVVEFDIDALIAAQAQPTGDALDAAAGTLALDGVAAEGGNAVNAEASVPQKKFKPISQYPFSARDVAVFVPGEDHARDDVLKVILLSLGDDQKKLLVRATLFDVFTKSKEGEPVKTSYAYRLVFQSAERTLAEEEVSGAMKAITDALSAQVGWEVR